MTLGLIGACAQVLDFWMYIFLDALYLMPTVGCKTECAVVVHCWMYYTTGRIPESIILDISWRL